MDKIGFVGLGIMGKPMAKNLLKAGFDVTFYARRPEVIKEAEEAGGKAVGSSKAVAEATDIIVTCVTADPEVREVILGENGVLEGASEGDLIVDMSTISPLTIREIAEAVALKGVHVMDAPISGGEPGAIAGTLTIMVAKRPATSSGARASSRRWARKRTCLMSAPLASDRRSRSSTSIWGRSTSPPS